MAGRTRRCSLEADAVPELSNATVQCLPTMPDAQQCRGEEKENEVCSQQLFDFMAQEFPGRSTQIKELMSILGDGDSLMPPLLVYGGPGTGKSSVVRTLFKHLRRPYAYVSCRSCHSPRIMFESVINQILGHRRSPENNYASAKKCEKVSDFVTLLPEACRQKKGILLDTPKKVETLETSVPHERKVIYLIFDNVEIIRDWAGGASHVSVLLKLSELTRMSNLGLILISTSGPYAFISGTGIREPLSLYFRDYTDDELYQILLKRHPNLDFYSSFLQAALKPFTRATRRVTELCEVLDPLFKKYCEPIVSGAISPDDQGKRKLFTLLKPHIRTSLNWIFTIWDGGAPATGGVENVTKGRGGCHNMSTAHEDVGFHLSLCSKYLLIAAYIASANPATLDATMFDSGGLAVSRKRKKRNSMSSMEKKDRDSHEKQLKGPGSFSLERLLAIFSCISLVPAYNKLGSDTENVTDGFEEPIELTADVLIQLSTLLSVNLISKGSTDPLEGSPRYWCNADETLIQKVARSVGFPLMKFLYFNY